MFKTRELAIEEMQKTNKHSKIIFNNLGEKAEQVCSKKEYVETYSNMFSILKKIDLLLIFRRKKHYEKGLKAYRSGDKETAYRISEEDQRNNDYLFYFNDIDIFEFIDYFEEIKELTKLKEDLFLEKILNEYNNWKEESKLLLEKEEISVYQSKDYLLAIFKHEVLDLMFGKNQCLEDLKVKDIKILKEETVRNCDLIISLKEES